MTAGSALLGAIDATPRTGLLAVYMAVLGARARHDDAEPGAGRAEPGRQADLGAASSLVAFFRSLGGAVGVAGLGAVLSHQVAAQVTAGLTAMGQSVSSAQSHQIPDLATLPGPVRALFQQAFGEATGHVFLVALPFAALALLCAVFIREVPLRTTILREDEVMPSSTTDSGELVDVVGSRAAR